MTESKCDKCVDYDRLIWGLGNCSNQDFRKPSGAWDVLPIILRFCIVGGNVERCSAGKISPDEIEVSNN